MNNLRMLLGLMCILAVAACKKDRNDPCPRNTSEELRLTIQDEYTSPPSKVSVFFKVDDKTGQPVAGLTSSDFTIYERGRNDACARKISSFESNANISNRKQIFSYNTILVLDLSASVTATSLTELKAASKSFIDEVMPADSDSSFYMTIKWFDGEDQLHELVPLTSNKSVLKIAIDNITMDLSNDPSTDLYGAVIKSAAEAETVLSAANSSNIISAVSVVIFTDGTDQAGRYLKGNALSAVNSASNNVRFFTIGLGEEIDEAVLQQIGKSSSVFAVDQSELETTFEEIGAIIWAEANSYYLFEYCSPKRNGSGLNDLRIEANYMEKIGSVLTQFDATGFTGGCQ